MPKLISLITGIGITILLLLACAPQTTPSLAPATGTPLPVAPVPAPIGAPSAEEVAWSKVVEAAKKEGKVTDYSYNFTGEVGIAISQAFKEKYGIKVDIVTGRGADFIERLKVERRMGSIMADMSDGGTPYLTIMKQEGLTVSVADELPALREKDVWLSDIMGIDPREKNLVVLVFTLNNPYVNTNLVKPGEEPKVWKDFLAPKWKSKIVYVDPTLQTSALYLFVPLMRQKVIDVEFIKSLYKQDLTFVSSSTDEGRMLAQGERAISIRGADSFPRLIEEGAPIKAIDIRDGLSVSPVVTVAYKGGPHPNAAKVFINWLMSKEGQTVFGKAASRQTARKDVANFLPEAARVTPTIPPIVITNEDTDEMAKLFRDRWLNKLWGR